MNTKKNRLSLSLNSQSNGSFNGQSDCRFLGWEELEVEAIMHRSLPSLNPLWDWIDPTVLRFFSDLLPVGPMKSKDPLILFVVFDYGERLRKPYEIFTAMKTEEMQNGLVWNLLWLLARIHGNHSLWDRYVGSIALGSPVCDGWSGRRFPYLAGTVSHPHIRLVSETAIGDPARHFKYIGRPADAPHLTMARSSLS